MSYALRWINKLKISSYYSLKEKIYSGLVPCHINQNAKWHIKSNNIATNILIGIGDLKIMPVAYKLSKQV